ncbi:MAG: hypothetical protein IPK26_03585 [Planctomycetes bacterium]|nr:hypothetical protein [Planctomycetota bacterium]
MPTIRQCLPAAAFAAAVSAQCTPPTVLATNEPFVFSHYMGTPTPPNPYPGFSHLFDVVVDGSVTITQIDCILYDDGAVNPTQIGNTAAVEIWITPTTWTGNELNQTVWAQIAAGTVTVAASSTHSPIGFGAGFSLPPGAWGVAILVQAPTAPQTNAGPLHPLYRIPCISPGNPVGCTENVPLAVRNQFLDLSNLGVQRYAWQSGGINRSTNLRFHFNPIQDSAYWTEYGTGCYRLPQSFYEQLPAGGSSDFGNVGIALQPVGTTHYAVGPAAATLAPVVSGPLLNAAGTAQLGLNETSAAQNLPFTFPFPGQGGATSGTSQIIVAANGFVWLSGTDGGGQAFGNNVPAYLVAQPRLAAFWANLDPSVTTGSGAVHLDVDPNNQFVTITWQNVQEWTGTPGGIPMNFQMALFNTGRVELRYGNTYATRTPALVGFTVGNGDLDPGSRDLIVNGAVAPFSSPDGARPLHLTGRNRPVLGTTFDLQADSIRAGANAGLLAVGTQGIPAGVSLAPFGLPPIGTSICNQYVALPVASVFFLVPGATAIVPFGLPLNPMFNGVELKYQVLAISPGLNPAGLIASNGLCVHAGLN